MANKKIQDVTLASLTSAGSFIGVKDNGDGTYTDIRVSAASLVSYILANSRKKIIAAAENISGAGKVLTDPFFSNTIQELVINKQVYVRDEDFTQSSTSITFLEGGFYPDLIVIAKL